MSEARPQASHRIARTFAALGSGEALARIVAFGTTLFVARQLGVEAYGVLALALAVSVYLLNGIEFGLQAVGVKAVAEREHDPARLASAIAGTRGVLALGLAAASAAIASALLPEPEDFILPIVFLCLLPASQSTRWVLVGLERAAPAARAQVFGELAVLGLVLLFVRGPDDLVIAAWAVVVSHALSALLMWRTLQTDGIRVAPRFDPQLAWKVLRPGVPVVAQILLGLLIFNADLFFLRFFVDREAVGLYAAAYTPISFATNIGYAFAYSVLPVLASESAGRRSWESGERLPQLFQQSVLRAYSIALPVAVGLALIARPGIELAFGSAYVASSAPLIWLAASLPFAVLTALNWSALNLCDRAPRLLACTVAAVILNVILNAFWIPHYGMVGAAAATLATEAARALGTSVVAGWDGLGPPALRRMLRPSAAGAAMGLAMWAIDLGIWIDLLLGSAVYCASLFALGGLRIRGGRPELSD